MQDAAPSSRIDRVAAGIVLLWLAVYLVRVIAGHYSLGTNAFDLSVYDYPIWSLAHGERGMDPIYGHSIFTHHFSPFLALLVPYYALFWSPVSLLVLQLAVVAAAGLMFFRFEQRIGVERIAALALLAVFLLSRRTHGAVVSFFYPEVFQTVLTFVIVATWTRGKWAYWTSAVLFLMTKEDAAIYLAAGAVVSLATPFRNVRRTVATVTLASVWLAFALLVVIPASRSAEGLPPALHIIENRFGSPGGHVDPVTLIGRLFSAPTGGHVANLLATAAGLPLVGGIWLLPALPGIVLNLAAEPGSLQASLTGHYVWPVLPWLFMATAAGVVWVSRRSRRLALAWVFLLLAATVAGNPTLQRVWQTRVGAEARDVRRALATLQGAVVLAQPNLIPHLPHQKGMFAIGGGGARPASAPDLVLLTEVGDLWPLTLDEVRAEVRKYDSDPAYERAATGPLHAFRLKRP